VQYGDGGKQANPISSNSWAFGAHPIVGTVCTNDTNVNVRTFPLKYVNVIVSACNCVALEDSGCQIPLVSNCLFFWCCDNTVGNVTLHCFGRDQTVRPPLVNLTVCLSDVDCENVRELPIVCAVTNICSHDYDVILPAVVVRNLQAKAVVSKRRRKELTVHSCCKSQPCDNWTTADRLSSGTKMGTAVGSRPRSSSTSCRPKCNLGCGMSQGAYAVTMLGIFCVALIFCIALCVVTNNHDVRFARVLTPAPIVLSCLSLSLRLSSSRQKNKFARFQPEPRQKRRQLLDEIADPFDDRFRRCDASIFCRQATDGLVRRRMRPCRTPDLGSASRSIRPSNSLMAGPIVCVAKKDGNMRIACRYRCLNSSTIGDAYSMPTIDEVMCSVGRERFIRAFDAKSDYWQIPLAKEHRWLTVFVTHDDLYEWLRLPFGFKNTGATVVRAVQLTRCRRGH